MTRINVIPVEELSDQHLIAEYRELPRCIKQPIDISDAPDTYCLGKGHMKWARKHSKYLLRRYKDICEEIQFRNFNPHYTWTSLLNWVSYTGALRDLPIGDYEPTEKDIQLNIKRIVEKYRLKPNWSRWTNRNKPIYMEVQNVRTM